MRRVVKKYLLSHEGNSHKPHLLRERGILSLLALVVLAFGAAHLQAYLIRTYMPAAVIKSIIVDLTNQDRESRGLKPLKVNPILERAAELKANDMVKNGYFSHISPAKITPWHWLAEVNYDFLYAGENLAVNFSESRDVETAWMESAGHRNNILNSKFTEIGIATAHGTLDGKQTVFVVQMFGKPRPQSDAPRVASANISNQNLTPTSTIPAKTDIKVTQVKDMYIAFEDSTKKFEPSQVSSSSLKSTRQSGWLSRFILSPSRSLITVYGVLSLLIILSLIGIVIGEIKKHHAKMAIYGGGLITIMLALAYTYNVYAYAMTFIM